MERQYTFFVYSVILIDLLFSRNLKNNFIRRLGNGSFTGLTSLRTL